MLLVVGEQVEQGDVEDAEDHHEGGGEGAVGELLVREDLLRVRVTVRVRVRVRVSAAWVSYTPPRPRVPGQGKG